MENQIKHKITRMFRSSFRSCKTKNISDVVVDENPIFRPHNPPPPTMLFSDIFEKPKPFPSICRPKFPQEIDPQISFPRTKISDQERHKTLFSSDEEQETEDDDNRATLFSNIFNPKPKPFPSICRPKFPQQISPQISFPRTKISDQKRPKTLFISSDEDQETEDDEDDRATLFSSAVSFSFSSDSSDSLRRRRAERLRRRRRRAARKRREAAEKEKTEQEQSFAVVKRSKDPYGDFRASMLEMIMEKQIFGAKDLEKLLECFLSLNSVHHHSLIIRVFTEICDALFSFNFCH